MDNLLQFFTSETNLFILFIISFFGGIVASLSPCSLSMLPLIVGYVGGCSNSSSLKTLIQMIVFVFGSSIVFSIIGIICALTGKAFVGNPYFILTINSIIFIMGLKLLGVLDFELPVIIKKMPQVSKGKDFLYPALLGAIFALIGTPCSTPILASIMAFSTLSRSILYSIIMLFLFSLGQGIIFIFAGFITSLLKNQNFYKISEFIMKLSGFFLVIMAIYIYYKIFNPIIAN